MSTNVTSTVQKAQSKRNPLQSILALCGMLGPVLFTIIVIILGQLQPGYSHVSQTVSALGEVGAANPGLQRANFIFFGMLIIAFSIGLSRGINDERGAKTGYLLLGVFGLVGLVASGLFPADAGGAAITFSGKAHRAASGIGFISAIVGILLVRGESKKDARWEDLSSYSLITGLTAIVLFIAFGSQISSPASPYYEIAGLLQRLFVLTLFQWFFVMGNRLRRVSSKEAI